MLKPGGKLIYSVPNADGFLKYQHNLLDMPPHHMSRWSIGTFKSLEKLFPIRLEKFLYEPLAKYHINDYIGSQSRRFRSISSRYKYLFNRYTNNVYVHLLKRGLRKYIKGHTTYVIYRKI